MFELLLIVAMAGLGVLALLVGELQLSPERVVGERNAKIVGALLIAPLPLTLAIWFLTGAFSAPPVKAAATADIPTWSSYVGFILATLFGIGALVISIFGSRSMDGKGD